MWLPKSPNSDVEVECIAENAPQDVWGALGTDEEVSNAPQDVWGALGTDEEVSTSFGDYR